MLNINSIGDHLTNRLLRLQEIENAREEALEAKVEFVEKQLVDGLEVDGTSLVDIAEIVLEDGMSPVALVTLFLHGRSQFFVNAMQEELTKAAQRIAPKLIEAENMEY